MATRIKEGMIPYTGGDGIEITDNHVINVLLRAANNLIHVNEDRELYVDLQLPAGIAPNDDFPVGVTTGEILAEDGWQQSGTILNWKTTSGDYVRLIYANDGNLYYDPGTGVWIMIGVAETIDVNTKTFFPSSMSDTTTAQAIIEWLKAGKNSLIIYNNRCYSLSAYDDNYELPGDYGMGVKYDFTTPSDNGTIYKIEIATDGTNYFPAASSFDSYSGHTRTFYVAAGTGATAKQGAKRALDWYLKRDGSLTTDNEYNPILLSPDIANSGLYTFHLTGVYTGVLIFASLILTDEAPNDYYMETITIYYSGTTVTSMQRNSHWLGMYRAGSGITIDGSTHEISANIQGALVFKGTVADVASLPSSGNNVGDTYYVTADGLMYSWDGTQWLAVGNTQIDLSNYFNMTVNTTDDITEGTNLFVTQAMIDGWNNKQGALTAGTNIQIFNNVISATDTTYTAGTGIGISNGAINNTLPFDPENAGTVGQVLKRTSTGVRWSNEFFENVFVTQAEYDALPSSKNTDGKTYFIYS